ncbi:hypothetical protein M3B90_05020 [Dermabacter sp. p3-SID358]|uniref:hypothetical protein n=1 Tax=Dermabacter sp. p3-SID358 TaxID=2916114 RepID=UPI0021A902A9|nr:hypothetical protein [Dermabacter sp. p3-SID358]MCT1866882.1 hypothetical protein [Dermabacter sp. p3-SID358]
MRTFTRRLSALATALLLGVCTACSGGDAPPSQGTGGESSSTAESASSAPKEGRVSDAEASPGDGYVPSQADSNGKFDESLFAPEAASHPGTRTQDNPEMWDPYATAGARTYEEDSAARGTFPEGVLDLGKDPAGDGSAYMKVFGEVISDVETSADRAAANPSDAEKAIVNRYEDSVMIRILRDESGASYVVAQSADTQHVITYAAKI